MVLYESLEIRDTTGDTTYPTANIAKGRVKPITSAYLSNDAFHASASSLAWYLFADPARLAAVEVAFLQGRQTPIVEEVDLPIEVLGKGFRAYHDFGVALQEYRGAQKNAGT